MRTPRLPLADNHATPEMIKLPPDSISNGIIATTDAVARGAYLLTVENGVLTPSAKTASNPDVTVMLTKPTLDRIQLNEVTPDQAIAAGDIKIAGKRHPSLRAMHHAPVNQRLRL